MWAIYLFTSIYPPTAAQDLAYLRDCRPSWFTAGFDVVAVDGRAATEVRRVLRCWLSWLGGGHVCAHVDLPFAVRFATAEDCTFSVQHCFDSDDRVIRGSGGLHAFRAGRSRRRGILWLPGGDQQCRDIDRHCYEYGISNADGRLRRESEWFSSRPVWGRCLGPSRRRSSRYRE